MFFDHVAWGFEPAQESGQNFDGTFHFYCHHVASSKSHQRISFAQIARADQDWYVWGDAPSGHNYALGRFGIIDQKYQRACVSKVGMAECFFTRCIAVVDWLTSSSSGPHRLCIEFEYNIRYFTAVERRCGESTSHTIADDNHVVHQLKLGRLGFLDAMRTN